MLRRRTHSILQLEYSRASLNVIIAEYLPHLSRCMPRRHRPIAPTPNDTSSLIGGYSPMTYTVITRPMTARSTCGFEPENTPCRFSTWDELQWGPRRHTPDADKNAFQSDVNIVATGILRYGAADALRLEDRSSFTDADACTRTVHTGGICICWAD